MKYKPCTLWCPECGKAVMIQRSAHKQKAQKHVKTMYCPRCQRKTHFQEVERFTYKPRGVFEVADFFGLEVEKRIDIMVDGERVLSYGGHPLCKECGYGIDAVLDGGKCKKCEGGRENHG